MSKFAVVSAASLVSSGRWDAGFHVLNDHYAERVATLVDAVPVEKAIELVTALAEKDLEPLEALTRGQGPAMRRETILRAIQAYPHLALAVVEAHLGNAKARADEVVSRAERYRGELGRIESLLAGIPDSPASAPSP